MRPASKVAVALTIACLFAVASATKAEPVSFIASDSPSTPDAVTMVYDPTDGNVSVDTGGLQFSTLEIVSEAGIWTGPVPSAISSGEPFNVFRPDKLFLLAREGMGNVDFGPAATGGISREALIADLLVDGSLFPSAI